MIGLCICSGRGHFTSRERNIFFQVAADAKRIRAAGENDRPDIVVGFGFLPSFIQCPIKVAANGIFFLRAIELDDRDMRIAFLVDT
jgi:hypothetical protein